ncbi:protein kinase [Pendulispora rubella]|uniref:Protein kinase n=1 Tax=Pendulispora rubella TaxID=2741070 RepID=A0ABZ2KZG4_9BACT
MTIYGGHEGTEHVGRVLGGRWLLDRLLREGGMGAVYRARDLETGADVAVKVVLGLDPHVASRFAREVRALAQLRHPRIVRYVGHGVADLPYLVMEWLQGEDLSARLARGSLDPKDTVALARAVAGALAAAHREGLVHRDIKPANIFLVDRDPARAKVLDFGLVSAGHGVCSSISRGLLLGTPAYMSPEQARGAQSSAVDASSDVFSFGVVLYKCLTGRAPFTGDNVQALALKIALEDPPRVASLRPGVPAELDALIAHMLAKEPAGRPRDGAELLARLDGIRLVESDPPAWLFAEQHLVSLVLLDLGSHAQEARRLADVVRAHGAEARPLGPGARFVALLEVRGSATDHAARAARMAMGLRRAFPHAPLAVVTGRAVLGGAHPSGESVDRAVHLLPRARIAGSIVLDDVTAALLEGVFDVARDAGGARLGEARTPTAPGRTLLGKVSPFVGRDREMQILEGALAESIAESVARVVLVTAPSGMGKSRLRRELAAKLDASRAANLWLAVGAPLAARSPFGFLRDLVRCAAGLRDGAPDAERRVELRARTAAVLGGEAAQLRVHEFLCELLGIGDPAASSAALVAARRDPALMHDQIRRAWIDWTSAACAAHPLLILLEDLHWGDAPSLHAIEMALRMLQDAPLTVVAFARPDVEEAFPSLFRERGVVEMRLDALPRRASERFVRALLGDSVPPAQLAAMVERAGGNAFYLEELIRAAAEGSSELPATVLAMVQARLEAMEPGARRVLRAASTFGRVFWLGAVRALLQGQEDAAFWLAELARREVIVPCPESRFRGDAEYAFRHETVREAAYAMLTDDDRPHAHRLAGEWLVAAGEDDDMVLAEHFERGHDAAAARSWYARAAERALFANDLQGALDLVRKAEACGASGESLGTLRLVQAEAHEWLGDTVTAEACSSEAMLLVPRHSDAWYRAAAALAVSMRATQNWNRTLQLRAELLSGAAPPPRAPALVALLSVARVLFYGNRYDEAAHVVRGVREAAEAIGSNDPNLLAHLRHEQSDMAYLQGELDVSLRLVEDAAELYASIGDRRRVLRARAAAIGLFYRLLGAYEESVRILRACVEEAERLALPAMAAHARLNLGPALAILGEGAEAVACEREAIGGMRNNPRLHATAHAYLALALESSGDLAGAERSARAALESIGDKNPQSRSAFAGILGGILLARGRPRDALLCAREGMDLLASLGGVEVGEIRLRLVHAEALRATGERPAAREAILRARARLLSLAGKLTEGALRTSFLERVPENARLLGLDL